MRFSPLLIFVLLAVCLISISAPSHADHSDLPADFFITQIFDAYSTNDILVEDNLDLILHRLKRKHDDHLDDDHHDHRRSSSNEYCADAHELFEIYDVDENDEISRSEFNNLAIALLYITASDVCETHAEAEPSLTSASYVQAVFDSYGSAALPKSIGEPEVEALYVTLGLSHEDDDHDHDQDGGACIHADDVLHTLDIETIAEADVDELGALSVALVQLVLFNACSEDTEFKARPSVALFTNQIMDRFGSGVGNNELTQSELEEIFQSLDLVYKEPEEQGGHSHSHSHSNSLSASSSGSKAKLAALPIFQSKAGSLERKQSLSMSLGENNSAQTLDHAIGHTDPSNLIAEATIDASGISGRIVFNQAESSSQVTITVLLTGLPVVQAHWSVHTFPVANPASTTSCDSSLIGAIVPNGDLTAAYGALQPTSMSEAFTSTLISLKGSNSLIGKSVLIFEDGGAPLACATIFNIAPQCFTVEEILFEYGVTSITSPNLGSAAIAIMSMLISGACERGSIFSSTSAAEAWGYGILMTIIICLASILGIFFVPYLRTGDLRESRVFLFFIALAIGVLVGDSILHLIPIAFASSALNKGVVILFGLWIMWIIEKLLDHDHGADHAHHNHTNQSIPLSDKEAEAEVTPSSGKEGAKIRQVGWLIIIGDGMHNLVDGLALGASFTVSLSLGFSTAIAILLHEIPHELGDFAVLLRAGFTVRQAVFWNLCSACAAFIGLFIGLGISEKTDATEWILAFTAGMFLYIALGNLMPELAHFKFNRKDKQSQLSFLIINSGIWFGFIVMILIARFEEQIEVDIH